MYEEFLSNGCSLILFLNSFSFLSCFQRETGSLGRLKTSLRQNVLRSPTELMKFSVPSLVYAVQNNMAFLALSNLDAAVYQVSGIYDNEKTRILKNVFVW